MKEKKKMVGIRCRCLEPPVKKDKEKMRIVMCPVCGKVYRTDRTDDVCFSCSKV